MKQEFVSDRPLTADSAFPTTATRVCETASAMLLNALIALMVLVIAMYLWVEPVLVSGESMKDTLMPGEKVVIDKIYKNAERGDIVVFVHRGERLIKRVIALGGDRIGFMYDEGDTISLWLDTGDGAKKLDEPYIKEAMTKKSAGPDSFGGSIFSSFEIANDEAELEEKMIAVEAGKFMALGDNRNVSNDSRHFGAFSVDSIVGKCVVRLNENAFLSGLFALFYREE